MSGISRRSVLVSTAAVAAGLAAGRPEPADASPVRERAAAEPPWVGAYAGAQDGSSDPRTLWTETNNEIGGGRLSYRRSFDPTIPAVGNEAWRDADAPANFYSMKPPGGDIAGYIAGTYDARLRAIANALPAGTKLTVYHEPEDNMPGQTFFRLTERTMSVVKSVRPDVEVWYIAMAYQWETNSKGNVGTNAGWIDAARIADAVGIDVYAPDWGFAAIPDDKGFKRWWNEIKLASGKPWGVIERGIDASRGESARVDILNEDWAFAKANQATMFLYWNSDWNENLYRLRGEREWATYRAITREGRVSTT